MKQTGVFKKLLIRGSQAKYTVGKLKDQKTDEVQLNYFNAKAFLITINHEVELSWYNLVRHYVTFDIKRSKLSVSCPVLAV